MEDFDQISCHSSNFVASVEAPTLADAIRAIGAWRDCPPRTVRTLTSAVRTAARMIGQPPEAIPADPIHLSAVLFERPPAAFGISKSSRTIIVSRLRHVLRRMGRHAPYRQPSELSAEWQSFIEKLTHGRQRGCLRSLGHWAGDQGLAPHDLTAAQILSFCQRDRENRILANAGDRERLVANAWNAAAAAHDDPDQFVSVIIPTWTKRYVKALGEFPESFQADLSTYAAMLGHGQEITPFSARLVKVRRPATIAARIFSIRQAASALVLLGIPISELRSLRDLITPIDRPRQILNHFFERSGKNWNGQIWNIAIALQQIAKDHLRLQDEGKAEEVAELKAFVNLIHQTKQKGMSGKARARLQELVQRLPLMLHLPATLRKRAEDEVHTDLERARLIRNAAVIEFLTFAPVRLASLRSLRIGFELSWVGHGPDRHMAVRIPGAQTKNGDDIDLPLPPDASLCLQHYIDKARPLLASPGNPYLFPGRGKGPMNPLALYQAVLKPCLAEVGVHVTPHMMRALAGFLYLKAHPGGYEVVRRILGHRNIKTTVDYYCGLETEAAATLLHDVITDQRHETQAVVAVSRRRPARRTERPSARRQRVGR